MARRLGVHHLDRIVWDPAPADVDPPAAEVFDRADRILVGDGDGSVLVAAPAAEVLGAVEDLLDRHPAVARRIAVASPRSIRRALIERFSAGLLRRAVRALLDRDPLLSAAHPVSALQLGLMVFVAGSWVVAVCDLSDTLLSLWAGAFLGLGVLRAHIADSIPKLPSPPPVADADLPRFAVLVPLHREARVVAALVAALSRLDYPAERLDVRLVVEGDDLDTIAAAEAAIEATPIDLVVVPPALPRTKPKALNFALATVDAPFVSVYDAEDRPDPDQLRRAAAAFRVGGSDLAVVQAALEIDHADGDRPWLVRQFEIEYAMLFRGLLPWLANRRLFLPLGGTSNHFRRDVLVAVGGWDPHNVTEDADVAVRLMRRGWRTAVIPSVTLEEAPLVLRSWWAQRIRWLKGWMQTWLVHMRRPWRLHREARLWPALSFHVVLAGQLASTFVFAPSLALFFARVFGLLPFLEDRAFVDDLLLVASLIGFTSGIAGSLVLAVRVAADDAGRRRRSPRVADLATMPIYWCLISVTAWWALLDLVVAPQRWNKTDHGLAERASSTPDPDDGLTPSAAAPRARASAGSCPSLAASCARPGGEAIDGDPRAGVVQG